MFLYVVIKDEKECMSDNIIKNKENIELAIVEKVLIVSYKKLTINMINELLPKAIIFSGFAQDLCTFDKNEFYIIEDVIKNIQIPILCICGSHQLLAEIYNKDIHEIDKLYNYPIKQKSNCDNKYYKADGFYNINLLSDDDIFKGLGKNFEMKCMHYCEVKDLPKNFILLASSSHSKIEAMKHIEKFIYGTQFHPEKYDDNNLSGKIFLENFSNMVEKYWKKRVNLEE